MRFDLIYGPMADGGLEPTARPAQLCDRGRRAAFPFGFVDVFERKRAKGGADRELRRYPFATLCRRRIVARYRFDACFIARLSRGAERNVRIFAEGAFPFDTVRPIFEPPQLAPFPA